MCTFTDRFFRSSSDDSSEDSDSEEDSSELELSVMKRMQYCSSQTNKNRNEKKNHIAKGLTIFFFFGGGGGAQTFTAAAAAVIGRIRVTVTRPSSLL